MNNNNLVKFRPRQAGVEIDKLDDVEHILQSADMFIGQTCFTESAPTERFIWNPETQLMDYQTVHCPLGLLKIFDEALVNAADNRFKGTTNIKVTVNTDKNEISVYNDGPNFAIVPTQYPSLADAKQPAYQPELAFFHPRCSTAYKKTKRLTGGKFGYGAKLVAIFSNKCTLDMCDGQTCYTQTAEQRLSKVHAPKMKPAPKSKQGKPYLKLTFQPDLPLFYPTGQAPATFNPELLRILQTRTYDIAGVTPRKTRVTWQLIPTMPKPLKVPVADFKQYVQLFLPASLKAELKAADQKQVKVSYFATERWQVCMIKNPWPFPCAVSFVNHINTYKGGQHVKYIQQQVHKYCTTALPQIDSRRVKNSVMLFINCMVEDAAFSNQSKDTLITLPQAFGSTCQLNPKFLNTLKRNGVLDGLKQALEHKQMLETRRQIGAGKRKSVKDLVKLRDARFAGHRTKAKECSIIFVEGLSALELADVGLTVKGTNKYGAFPLRGKIKNAEASIASVAKNAEFQAICRILGLEIGKPTTRAQLRYNKIIILTDADKDGSHIKLLLILIFRKFWPHLLKEPGFMNAMITPILVARQGKKTKPFFTQQKFEAWWDTLTVAQRRKWTIKYYKGLGTSTKKDGQQYFGNLDQHLVSFAPADQKDLNAIDLAVGHGPKAAQARKTWLQTYSPHTYLPYENMRQVSYQDFVEKDFKHYSWSTLRRNLPQCEDGLTPAARKCLWTMFKQHQTREKKVAELQADVSSSTNYHHGVDSLGQTLVRMAQDFVGKTNLNLLVPEGQFGTRKDGGKTHSQTRYIFTRLHPLTRKWFCPEDDPVLTMLEDEGKTIEPETLAPIIPCVLANGCNGTATAYRANVPAYNPLDLISAVRRELNQEPWAPIQPWYHKFTGEIKGDAQGNFTSQGIVTQISPLEWHVTELALGQWVEDYKSFLNKLLTQTQISDFHERHQDEQVCFEVTLAKPLDPAQDPYEFFRLRKNFSSQLNLMVADEKGPQIRCFNSIQEIFQHWFQFRRTLYHKRHNYLINQLQALQPTIESKIRFVQDVVDGKFPLGRPQSQMHDRMRALGIPEAQWTGLLGMSLSKLSAEQIVQLRGSLEKCLADIRYYQNLTGDNLWLQDLQILEGALNTQFKNT